jgi:hypothetical protein
MSNNKQLKEEINTRNRDRGIHMGLAYEIEVRDKNGQLLSLCKGDNDPFTRAWIRLLRTATLGGGAAVSLLDTTGTSRNFYGSTTASMAFVFINMNAGSGDVNYGVRVGTSDTAFSKDQYELQAKIGHGTGAGQLVYGATSIEDYADEDSTTRFRVTRTFTNNSGAVITVKEIGIAIDMQIGSTHYYGLISRDVLTSPQSVPDGATLTVRYRFYISYA